MLSVITAVATGILFAITAAKTKPSLALEVLLDINAPYGRGLDGWAVALAIAGWIMVPVLVGAVASLVIEEGLRHQRYPLAEAVARLQKELEEVQLAQEHRQRDAADQ
jgi:hypothetical protein